jgi:hypothetical protein
MNLYGYIVQLDAGNTSAPDKITLPAPFAAQLLDLYSWAEPAGRERGCRVICDRGSNTFATGEAVYGLRTSMKIPDTELPGNFGDAHAHPSDSIGHAGGFSAHSMSDLRNFADTASRPFWMQFVVSGPWIYAMVQVNGVSILDATADAFFIDRTNVEGNAITDAVLEAAGGAEKLNKRIADLGVDPSPEQGEALSDKFKTIAQVGAIMQRLSVKHCAEFARAYNFLFYTGVSTPGQEVALTRMLSV